MQREGHWVLMTSNSKISWGTIAQCKGDLFGRYRNEALGIKVTHRDVLKF